MVIDDFSDQTFLDRRRYCGFQGDFAACSYCNSYQYAQGATTIYPSIIGYETFMEPETALNVLQYVLISALQQHPVSTSIMAVSIQILFDYSDGMLDKHHSFRTYRVSS